MKSIEVKEKQTINDFLSRQTHSSFLQSWQWGVFQEGLGQGVVRLAVEKEGQILALATLIEKTLFLGKKYYYCPKGPVFDKDILNELKIDLSEVYAFLLTEIKKQGLKKNIIFFRFEPPSKIDIPGFVIKNTIDLQPAKTLVLDLRKKEERLLEEMHKKTRYNIRLSERKGVEIKKASKDDFDKFWQLMETTAERDGFRIHPKNHYQKILEIHGIEMYFAHHKDKVVSAGIFSFFGDTATYMHGASDNQNRNLMSTYLLQWQVINIAKTAGYSFFDFYGIDSEKWPGVTRFKKGFGGKEISAPGTKDIAFDSVWYNVYITLRAIRRKL